VHSGVVDDGLDGACWAGLVAGGCKGDDQGAATEDERSQEMVSVGRNDAVQTNENAPARSPPTIKTNIPFRVPVLLISRAHVGA